MVVIDHVRCAYCGGCVSICPEEALSLVETRLEVDEACVDCGDCIPACPVGALRAAESEQPAKRPKFRKNYDLVVVGAGPGGSTAAYEAAQAGFSVLLLEKRQDIGSPVRCAEGIGHEQLTAFIEPSEQWIAAEVTRSEFTSIADGERRTMSVGVACQSPYSL